MRENTETGGRLAAFGRQLVEIHLWLREELDRLRDDVDAYLDGEGDRPDAAHELRAHCLTFCSALSRHHTGEDGGAFRVLAAERPELRPVLEELAHDHEIVADILRRLEAVLAGLPAAAAPGPAEAERIRGELDGLSALLESHFVYEEKKLVAALDALPDGAGTTVSLLGVPAPGTDGTAPYPAGAGG